MLQKLCALLWTDCHKLWLNQVIIQFFSFVWCLYGQYWEVTYHNYNWALCVSVVFQFKTILLTELKLISYSHSWEKYVQFLLKSNDFSEKQSSCVKSPDPDKKSNKPIIAVEMMLSHWLQLCLPSRLKCCNVHNFSDNPTTKVGCVQFCTLCSTWWL